MTKGELITLAIELVPASGTCSTVQLAEAIAAKTDLPIHQICKILGRSAENELRQYASRAIETKNFMGKEIRPWIWHSKKPGASLDHKPDRLDEVIMQLNAVLVRLDNIMTNRQQPLDPTGRHRTRSISGSEV